MNDIKQVNEKEYEELVLGSSETVILVASASWCQPCKAYNKVLEAASKEDDVPMIYKLDIDEEPEIAAKYKIRSVPTTIVFKAGKVEKIVPGSMSKDKVLELIK